MFGELQNTQQNTQQQAFDKNKQARKQKEKNEPLLVSCTRFKYIGTQDYVLKDAHSRAYKLKPQESLIVPQGSLEQHLNARKTLFIKE